MLQLCKRAEFRPVDYAGLTMDVVDTTTGDIRAAQSR
jgi:hypothetical protein